MIAKKTTESLNLKSYTKSSCNDLYKEIFSKYRTNMYHLEKDLLTNHIEPELLNKFWWVLNYHSESMDSTRKLRAIVEAKLEQIAKSVSS